MKSPGEPEEGEREREGEEQGKPEQAGEQGDDGGDPEEDRAEVFKGELIDEGITYKQGGLIFILTMIMSVFLVTLVFIVITNANSFKGTDAIITGGVISVLGLLTFLASILSSQVLLGIVRMHYFIIKEIQHTTDPEKILDGIIDYYK